MIFSKNERLFPRLQIPDDIGTSDAIVVASGPSLSDFDLTSISQCGAKLYGAGYVHRLLRLDHFVMVDHPIESHNPCQLHICENLFEKARQDAYPLLDRLIILPKSIRKKSAGATALYLAASHGPKRIFLIGMDGLIDNQGFLRTNIHAEEVPSINNNIEHEHGHLHISEMDQIRDVRKAPFRDKIYSLSASSILNCIVPLHKRLAEQSFGMIDKHSLLIIVDCKHAEGYETELEILLKEIRRRDPCQAVLVLNHWNVSIPPFIPDIVYFSGNLNKWHLRGFSRWRIIRFQTGSYNA